MNKLLTRLTRVLTPWIEFNDFIDTAIAVIFFFIFAQFLYY